ncbi:MFS transporter [Neobacillus sp. OS1-32]|uniref:MFS transporter n=1 Tax=Neobacillus sp. OS1-32 TaxID=3070682 RepID=UPI0027E1373E|nr:MFS transporter [Neobacillus sp. OS1-32]WML31761.1 MFS transporter [Neobacillus sp. OS1-32]
MGNVIKNPRAYELKIVAIIFLTWGFVFLDRTALSYITPVLVNELGLTNGQVGQINMWQTIGYAIAGPIIGMISDKTSIRKALLIGAVISTSIFSAISALATSYPLLLVVRFLVGASEGPILPLAVTLVASASLSGHFGRNVGIVNAGVGVISGTLGPTLVTQIVAWTNWHLAFVLVSIPSLILALLIWKVAHEVKPINDGKVENKKEKVSFAEILKYRNVIVSLFIGIMVMTGFWIQAAFAPLYLTSVGKHSIENMGFIMSMMGIVTIITCILVPLFSDYFGRKPGLILFSVFAALSPLGLYLFPSTAIGSGSLILFGGLFGAIAPLYMSIIPEETMPPHLKATTSALIIGVGEIFGAAFVVAGAGAAADVYGLPIVMIIATIAALLIAVIGLGLIETNPRKKKTGIESERMKTKTI